MSALTPGAEAIITRFAKGDGPTRSMPLQVSTVHAQNLFDRSVPNHLMHLPDGISPVLRNLRARTPRFRLRHLRGGSPITPSRIGYLRTGRSLSIALHPASRQMRLCSVSGLGRPGEELRPHWLCALSCAHVTASRYQCIVPSGPVTEK